MAKNKRNEANDDFAKFSRAVGEAVTAAEEETQATAGGGAGDESGRPEGVGPGTDAGPVGSAGGVGLTEGTTPPQEDLGVRGVTGKLLSETFQGGKEYPPPKVKEGVNPLLVEAHKALRQLVSIFPPAEVIIPGVGELVARLRREIEGGG